MSPPADSPDAEPQGHRSRWRVRFSLLNLLSLTTIIALAITLALTSRRLRISEQELHRRRIESGHVSVTDPERVHAVGVYTGAPRTWKWRVFLPTTGVGRYALNCYIGRHRPFDKASLGEWFCDFPNGMIDWTGREEITTLPRGELTIEVRLKRKSDQWFIQVTPDGTKRSPVNDDWLTKYGGARVENGLKLGQQSDFHRGGPVPVLLLQGYPYAFRPPYRGKNVPSSTVADSIVVWISRDDKKASARQTQLDVR